MSVLRLLRGLVSAGLIALFLLALTQAGAARLLLHVLAVLGVGAVWQAGRKPWNAEDRRLFGAILFFVLMSVPSLAVHPTPYGASRLGLIAMTLLALPIAAGLLVVSVLFVIGSVVRHLKDRNSDSGTIGAVAGDGQA
jgi:hypothetical protein